MSDILLRFVNYWFIASYPCHTLYFFTFISSKLSFNISELPRVNQSCPTSELVVKHFIRRKGGFREGGAGKG